MAQETDALFARTQATAATVKQTAQELKDNATAAERAFKAKHLAAKERFKKLGRSVRDMWWAISKMPHEAAQIKPRQAYLLSRLRAQVRTTLEKIEAYGSARIEREFGALHAAAQQRMASEVAPTPATRRARMQLKAGENVCQTLFVPRRGFLHLIQSVR